MYLNASCFSLSIGIGDYSRDGIHCDINNTAIKALNIIGICVATVCNLLIIIVINIHCRIDACIGSVFYHMLSPDSLHVVVCLLHMLHIPP